MKNIFLFFLLLWVLALPATAQDKPTPFYYAFHNADGTPNPAGSNFQMQAWPPSNTYTVYGTNFVYGGQIITLTNDVLNGYGTNQAFANTYRILNTNVTPAVGFFVNLPISATPINLVNYITGSPVINPNGQWGGFRGQTSDTNLEFLTSSFFAASPFTVTPNTTNGATSITLTYFDSATNLIGKINPTNITFGSFYTNALVTNLLSTPLWTNATGLPITGTVSWLASVTTALSNNFTFSVVSTNESGAQTLSFAQTNNATGYMTNKTFEVTVNNGTILTFSTICTTNETYNLRVAFKPWLTQ